MMLGSDIIVLLTDYIFSHRGFLSRSQYGAVLLMRYSFVDM